ncbi:hypothetical protein QBC34DRAFT_38315 [Podospora aff. communis PSN243]|uniref:Uncharacterized protein n=1 Tax=Podospora aff. communis PSN243 TaxID=3040156 RepID=A0AAV9GWF2_9PEZI|nr:hypothetical protein QBC34DRAFT_38315 [Podospora aff. communis PSN243]
MDSCPAQTAQRKALAIANPAQVCGTTGCLDGARGPSVRSLEPASSIEPRRHPPVVGQASRMRGMEGCRSAVPRRGSKTSRRDQPKAAQRSPTPGTHNQAQAVEFKRIGVLRKQADLKSASLDISANAVSIGKPGLKSRHSWLALRGSPHRHRIELYSFPRQKQRVSSLADRIHFVSLQPSTNRNPLWPGRNVGVSLGSPSAWFRSAAPRLRC